MLIVFGIYSEASLEKHFILLLNGGVAENVKEMFPQEFRHIIVCNKNF